MIVRMRGTVIEHDGDIAVIDCNGVGYGVHVCFDEQQRLTSDTSCDLYIAEMIKEDAHELFGFSQKSRKQLFDLLTSVNGIGPKAAMAILNVGNDFLNGPQGPARINPSGNKNQPNYNNKQGR